VNGSGQARHRRYRLLVASLVFGLIVLSPAGSGAAEAGNASPHDVAEGLRKIQSIAVDAAAYTGKDRAKAAELAGSIEGVWKNIEDTVRGSDKDAYIAFEDAFEALGAGAKAGDATKTGKAAHSVGTAVGGYLAKHPDVPSAAPRAASSAAPTGPAPTGSAASAAAPAPAPGSAASASAPAGTSAAAGSPTPAGPLARTGPHTSALAALAGAAFGLGGLAVIAGARRRRLSPTG
jgi:hypothetical protein